MKNIGEVSLSAIGTGTSAVGTAMQPNQILQTISLIITIVGGIITTAIAIHVWWKNAKKDGKITKEELEEGAEILINGAKGVKQTLEDKKKGDK